MRPIKFRVRNIQTGGIIGYEYLLDQGWVFEHISGGVVDGVFEQGKGFIRESYAGLEDKNGKEIYEGDVANQVGVDKKEKYTIEWDEEEARFIAVSIKERMTYPLLETEWLKVIGNIYENKELLK